MTNLVKHPFFALVSCHCNHNSALDIIGAEQRGQLRFRNLLNHFVPVVTNPWHYLENKLAVFLPRPTKDHWNFAVLVFFVDPIDAALTVVFSLKVGGLVRDRHFMAMLVNKHLISGCEVRNDQQGNNGTAHTGLSTDDSLAAYGVAP